MYFLKRVADQIYSNHGNNLRRNAIVFPNRRAGIFFMKHLAAVAGRPVWAPEVITIDELFGSSTKLVKAENERLVFELYKLYSRLSKSRESIDNFWFWGEMLLGDFDDADKYMVDAGALFTNIADLHAIDEKFGGMSAEQMEIIKRFIFNFRAGDETDEKRDFEFTWSLLFPLYTEFREVLKSKGVAYEGMIYREIASLEGEAADELFAEYDHYHFVGFNALNRCEERVMEFLKRRGKAFFYWDYCENRHFEGDESSTHFITPNIVRFGQDLVADDKEILASAGGERQHIEIIDIPSDAGQAKLVPELIDREEHNRADKTEKEIGTAIILADENLLPALLTSLPPTVKDINITMGYPFSMTIVYSLLRTLLNLQERPVKVGDRLFFDFRKVLPLLSNPLVTRVAGGDVHIIRRELIKSNSTLVPETTFMENPFLASLFRIDRSARELCEHLREVLVAVSRALADTGKENGDKREAGSGTDSETAVTGVDSGTDEDRRVDKLTPEFLFRAGQVLNRLEALLYDDEVTIPPDVFIRLTDRIFREIKIPFRGEPLKGVQIMGLLESRALDFDRLIVLSANEGVLPAGRSGASYIPYSLREAFGMPTIRHQDSIFSYYFNRLLLRPERVTLIYNSSAEGLRSGEMSRYLLRLKYNSESLPAFLSTHSRINQQIPLKSSRERSEADIAKLESYFSSANPVALSPSAVNTWINCSMRFYYSRICGLKEPDRISATIDPALFGTILHEVVSEVYKPFIGSEVATADIQALIKQLEADPAVVNSVMESLCYGGTGGVVTGTGLVTAEIVLIYLKRVLEIDSRLAPFEIISLEKVYRRPFRIKTASGEREVILGGTIDRTDRCRGVVRLIDYKTGKSELTAKSLDELFDSEGNKLNDAIVQTMIYSVIAEGYEGFDSVRPVIYTLRNPESRAFEDRITVGGEKVDDFAVVRDRFEELLRTTLEDIFDPAKPFIMTSQEKRCAYCPYKNMCNR